MAVVLPTATKTSMLTALLNLVDGGGSAGSMEIGTTGFGTILATLPLSYPSGTVSSGVYTFTVPFSDSSADNTGTAATARIKNSSGTVIVTSMSVGTSGSDVNLSSTSITTGQTVTITSAQFTM